MLFRLAKEGLRLHIDTYPATHAFFGFPLSFSVSHTFRQSTADALRDVLSFLGGDRALVGGKKHAAIPTMSLLDRVFLHHRSWHTYRRFATGELHWIWEDWNVHSFRGLYCYRRHWLPCVPVRERQVA